MGRNAFPQRRMCRPREDGRSGEFRKPSVGWYRKGRVLEPFQPVGANSVLAVAFIVIINNSSNRENVVSISDKPDIG